MMQERMEEEVLCDDPDLETVAMLKEKAVELFSICDKECKGFITRRDLMRLTHEMPLSPDILEEVFDKLDDDGNGYLSLEEFTDGFGWFLGYGQPPPPPQPAQEEGDSDNDSEQFEAMLAQINGHEVVNDPKSLKEIWKKLRSTDPRAVNLFEEFIQKVVGDMRRTITEQSELEHALRVRSSAHDEELQKLYEEMEMQIDLERKRILREEQEREQRIKEDLTEEVMHKEKQLNEMIAKKNMLAEQLKRLNAEEHAVRNENDQLLRKNENLEDAISKLSREHEETQVYLKQIRDQINAEKRERAKAALRVNESIARERMNLVQELDKLREANKMLKDERDELANYKAQVGMIEDLLKQVHNQSLLDIEDGASDTDASDIEDTIVPVDAVTVHCAVGVSDGAHVAHEEPVAGSHLKFPDGKERGVKNKQVKKIGSMEKAASIEKLSSNINTIISASNHLAAPGFGERRGSILANYTSQDGGGNESDRSSDSDLVEDADEVNMHDIRQEYDRRKQLFFQNVEENVNWNKSSSLQSTLESSEQNSEPHVQIIENLVIREGAQPKNDSVFSEMTAANLSNVVRHRIFKIVLVGDSGVGKTSFIHRVCKDSFNDSFNATVGVDYQVKQLVLDDTCYSLQFWDTAGQERFRSITRQFFRRSDAIVIMYDVTNERSLLNVRDWITCVEEEAEEDVVLMLLGSKSDKKYDMDVKCAAIDEHDGQVVAVQHKAAFMEVSAKSGSNCWEAVQSLANELSRLEDKDLEDARNIVLKSKKKSGCAC